MAEVTSIIVTPSDTPEQKQQETLSETEKMLQQEAVEATTEETTQEEVQKEDKPEDEPDLESLDLSKYEQEFAENFELSEDSIKELVKTTKLPEKTIRTYIDAVKSASEAMTTQVRTQVLDYAGGEAQYNGMIEWATQNLSEDEKKGINKYLNSADIEEIKIGVDALTTRFNKANPAKKPEIINNGKPPAVNSTVKPYGSRSEWLEDMRSNRYDKDEKFRDAVGKRLAVSNI